MIVFFKEMNVAQSLRAFQLTKLLIFRGSNAYKFFTDVKPDFLGDRSYMT